MKRIGQELATIVKQSQIRLQLCDIGRTLGLHDYIHLLSESKKLEARLGESALRHFLVDQVKNATC